MGFSRTQTIDVALTTSQVWDMLTDPGAWLQFDDQLQQFAPIDMAGERLKVGDRVKVVPKALIRGFVHAATAPPATIVTVKPQREIAWRQDQPGGFTAQRWQIESREDGSTRLTRHTQAIGPFAAPFGATLAAPLAGDLGAVGARMFQMAADGPDTSQPLTLVSGGSGYLGSRLVTRMLADGKRAVVLTRSPTPGAPYPQTRWSVDDLGPLHEQLLDPAGFNIINLAGKRIGPKFSAQEVEAQETSRIPPTRALRDAVEAAQTEGGILHRWIQGSAIPLWDAQSTEEFTEDTAPTADIDGPKGMGQLVADWEASAPDEAIIIRTAIVLGQQTEIGMGLGAMALSKTRPSVDGYLPWIHEEDWIGIVRHLLDMQNPPARVIAVAPQLTHLSEVINALAPGLGTRHIPLPAALLNIGMNIIRMEPGLLMGSTKARSVVLDDAGYQFHYPTIAAAADSIRI